MGSRELEKGWETFEGIDREEETSMEEKGTRDCKSSGSYWMGSKVVEMDLELVWRRKWSNSTSERSD